MSSMDRMKIDLDDVRYELDMLRANAIVRESVVIQPSTASGSAVVDLTSRGRTHVIISLSNPSGAGITVNGDALSNICAYNYCVLGKGRHVISITYPIDCAILIDMSGVGLKVFSRA